MTDDKELIARLRKADEYEPLGHDGWEAADRIDALIAENAKLHDHIEGVAKDTHKIMVGYEAKLAECKKYRDAYAECDRIGTQAVRDLEAKLAENEVQLRKAVEALESLIQQTHDCEKELTEDLHHVDFCGESEPLTKARATLAEIKGGESHE